MQAEFPTLKTQQQSIVKMMVESPTTLQAQQQPLDLVQSWETTSQSTWGTQPHPKSVSGNSMDSSRTGKDMSPLLGAAADLGSAAVLA